VLLYAIDLLTIHVISTYIYL